MGNCSSEFIEAKHSAAENLENLFEGKGQSTPMYWGGDAAPS